MEWVQETTGIPVKSWCKDVETGAWSQAQDLAKLPVCFRHIALMPDCHQGYGMPIGGVIALENAVSPSCVGVDIGCGVQAIQTNIKTFELPTDKLKKMMGLIREVIPVGKKHNQVDQEWEGFEKYLYTGDIPIVLNNIPSARKQLGTLGGGNHFIEFQKDEENYVWLMVHSGSRNIGYRIAQSFNKLAMELCDTWRIDLPNKDLAYLPTAVKEGQDYIKAMTFALKFAGANRDLIINKACKCILDVVPCNFDTPIDIHHNFAGLENHFGRNLWVHRKGATPAYEGRIGIIPGSMGTNSYIVEGLGNIESFRSCSHGAGRNMSRTQANKTFTEEQCNKDMEGVIFGRWGKDRKGKIDLSEAPIAYKDIHVVMEQQKDLVKPIMELTPIGVIKGD